MELKDTAIFMNSESYKERFKAEYFQLKIRLDKLSDYIKKVENKEVETTTPIDMLMSQHHFMKCYKEILETRAIMEDIDISEEN